MDIKTLIREMGQKAWAAAEDLRLASNAAKNEALKVTAKMIRRRQQEILAANDGDLVNGTRKGLPAAMLDRLMLTPDRLEGLTNSLDTIAEMPDPVGKVLAHWTQASGLTIKRVSTPLGVIGVIFESRPNVTIDAAALCLKSGNVSILRGGSDSYQTARSLHACFVDGLKTAGLPLEGSQIVPTRDRAAVNEMLSLNQYIDVLVPRGGKSLVDLVQNKARVPVFAHLEGICHVFVDKDADLEKAIRIAINAKTRRPGICGAAECLLIDQAVRVEKGEPIVKELLSKGVEVRASQEFSGLAGVRLAASDDFGKEFLANIIAVKTVDGVDGAIGHISAFGSSHTDAIITENDQTAQKFFTHLDSAILMRNASTQFADGGEFGMGAEIGIATGRIHARGPVGTEQLTSFKYWVEGQGTIRP